MLERVWLKADQFTIKELDAKTNEYQYSIFSKEPLLTYQFVA